MSFQDLRPYLKARIAVADADFTEHTDLFPDDNIPTSLINKSYHIVYGNFVLSTGVSNGAFTYDGPVTVNFYFNGYEAPLDTIDTVWIKAETIIQEVCRHSERLSQANIKGILAQDVSVSLTVDE